MALFGVLAFVEERLHGTIGRLTPYTDGGQGLRSTAGILQKWHPIRHHPGVFDSFHVTHESSGSHIYYALTADRSISYLTAFPASAPCTITEYKWVPSDVLATSEQIAKDFLASVLLTRTFATLAEADQAVAKLAADRRAAEAEAQPMRGQRIRDRWNSIRREGLPEASLATVLLVNAKDKKAARDITPGDVRQMPPDCLDDFNTWLHSQEGDLAGRVPGDTRPALPVRAPPPSGKRRLSSDGQLHDIPSAAGGEHPEKWPAPATEPAHP